jgi:hypothetical protein
LFSKGHANNTTTNHPFVIPAKAESTGWNQIEVSFFSRFLDFTQDGELMTGCCFEKETLSLKAISALFFS